MACSGKCDFITCGEKVYLEMLKLSESVSLMEAEESAPTSVKPSVAPILVTQASIKIFCPGLISSQYSSPDKLTLTPVSIKLSEVVGAFY